MINRWTDMHWKELAQVPYLSPEKIRSDTRAHSQNLRYWGERFLSEFACRVSSSKPRRTGGAAGQDMQRRVLVIDDHRPSRSLLVQALNKIRRELI